ncbi:MAG: hypothetical protein K9I85_12105 [Saprospiraceae bacterium]|nr:hypothetical protein [Saprospiraceae bacterium]
MTRILTLVSLLLIMALTTAQAQREIGTFGLGFQVGIPNGAFQDAYDKVGFGGGMDIYFKIHQNAPLYAGLNLSLMGFEQLRRDFNVLLPGGFVGEYRLRASSNLFSGYGGLRIMPSTGGWVQPYAEGLIGFKNFFVSKRLEQRENFSNEWQEYDSDTDGDWALGYGGAAGIMFYFGQSGIALDLRCSYLAGGEVTFYKLQEDIDEAAFEEDPFSAFDPVKATTNMLIPQIGIVFRLRTDPPDEDLPVIMD